MTKLEKAAAIEKAKMRKAEQEPVAWKCYRNDGTHYFIEHDPTEVEKFHGFTPSTPLYSAPVEPVKQEPVARVIKTPFCEFYQLEWVSAKHAFQIPEGTLLCAATVKTEPMTEKIKSNIFKAWGIK